MAFTDELEKKLGFAAKQVSCRVEWFPGCAVVIEGCRGLYYYSPECVKVRAKKGKIVVEGEGLYVSDTRAEEIVLRGNALIVRWE